MIDAFLHETRIPLRVRKKIGKLIKVRPGQPFTARLFESEYAGVTGNHLDNKTFVYGMHEPASIRFMRGVLDAQRRGGVKPVYFDVGTNTGAHLIAIAPRADRAFGFEPWAPVRAHALDNLARNDLAHAQVMDYGLGAAEAALPFTPPSAENLGTGSFHLPGDGTTVLRVRTGDTVVGELGVAPTLIKIDTEGFEDSVLQGFTNTLRDAKPVVVFEYSAMTKAQLSADRALIALFGHDYEFYGLKPSREYPKAVPFKLGRRYENVIAWPKGAIAIEDALRR